MRVLYIPIFLTLFISISGCTSHYFTGTEINSHFSFPNSNVIPISNTKGEASIFSFISPIYVTSDLKEKAINDAIKKVPGSDMLLDYNVFIDRFSFSIVTKLTLRVEGMAAKMEIGKQELKLKEKDEL